jgi:hypothetical protein
MLIPMLLGYVVGSVGIYTLLYKVSPVVTDDHMTRLNASGDGVQQFEVIELFGAEETAEQRKAA